jgi:hypothetical protein
MADGLVAPHFCHSVARPAATVVPDEIEIVHVSVAYPFALGICASVPSMAAGVRRLD